MAWIEFVIILSFLFYFPLIYTPIYLSPSFRYPIDQIPDDGSNTDNSNGLLRIVEFPRESNQIIIVFDTNRILEPSQRRPNYEIYNIDILLSSYPDLRNSTKQIFIQCESAKRPERIQYFKRVISGNQILTEKIAIQNTGIAVFTTFNGTTSKEKFSIRYFAYKEGEFEDVVFGFDLP